MSMTATSARRGARGIGPQSVNDRLATGLGWFSVGLGLAELFGARALCAALGMGGHETLVRAYGARELATGVAILMSHDPTPWICGRVAGDAVDLATLATGFKGNNPHLDNLAIATAAVLGVTVLDLVCAEGLMAEKRLSDPGRYDFSDRSGFPRPAAAMRGAARDVKIPSNFRIPGPLRPWQNGQPR